MRMAILAASGLAITACAGGDIAPLPSPNEPVLSTSGVAGADEPERGSVTNAGGAGQADDDNFASAADPSEEPAGDGGLPPAAVDADIIEPDADVSEDAAEDADAVDEDASGATDESD